VESAPQAARRAQCPTVRADDRGKGHLTRYEKQLSEKPWHEARPGVQVKLLPPDGELYVLAKVPSSVAEPDLFSTSRDIRKTNYSIASSARGVLLIPRLHSGLPYDLAA
jgi:hypothetical protein